MRRGAWPDAAGIAEGRVAVSLTENERKRHQAKIEAAQLADTLTDALRMQVREIADRLYNRVRAAVDEHGAAVKHVAWSWEADGVTVCVMGERGPLARIRVAIREQET